MHITLTHTYTHIYIYYFQYCSLSYANLHLCVKVYAAWVWDSENSSVISRRIWFRINLPWIFAGFSYRKFRSPVISIDCRWPVDAFGLKAPYYIQVEYKLKLATSSSKFFQFQQLGFSDSSSINSISTLAFRQMTGEFTGDLRAKQCFRKLYKELQWVF